MEKIIRPRHKSMPELLAEMSAEMKEIKQELKEMKSKQFIPQFDNSLIQDILDKQKENRINM